MYVIFNVEAGFEGNYSLMFRSHAPHRIHLQKKYLTHSILLYVKILRNHFELFCDQFGKS